MPPPYEWYQAGLTLEIFRNARTQYGVVCCKRMFASITLKGLMREF